MAEEDTTTQEIAAVLPDAGETAEAIAKKRCAAAVGGRVCRRRFRRQRERSFPSMKPLAGSSVI